MKKFYNSILLVLCLTTTNLVAQNVNITTKINGFRHNWDCCNDGASILCIGSNFPDPRYKVWIGYNGTTFSQSTNGPGLYCGASDYTYGADAEDCSTWNPGEITGPAFSNVAATSVNVDMQSWEDDGCGSNCVPDGPSSNPLDACFYNADDTRCGRLRIGDIDFSVYAPCSDQTYNGAFTGGTFLSMHNRCGDNNGAGYGLDQFKINWNFAAAPTVITHPSDASYGGAIRDVCTGLPITLTVDCNKFGTGNWTLGRWVKWQSSPDGVNWTDLGGTGGVNVSVNTGTTFTYNFTPTVAGTIYYRSVLSSLCNSGFGSQTTNSNSVKFIVHDATTDPYCTAPQCNIAYVDPTLASEVGATGTPSNPYKNISTAATTGYTYIRVAKGTGTDGTIVSIPNNAVIEGGYVRTGSSLQLWEKSSNTADKTIITFSGSETINSDVAHVVGFKSNNVGGWKLVDLTVRTATSSGNTTSGNGKSNYAIYITGVNSTGYEIIRCDIAAAAGSEGLDGTAGNPGQDGTRGARGGNGGCSCSNDDGGGGGNGGAGGAGGSGGPGGNGGPGGSGGFGGGGGNDNGTRTSNTTVNQGRGSRSGYRGQTGFNGCSPGAGANSCGSAANIGGDGGSGSGGQNGFGGGSNTTAGGNGTAGTVVAATFTGGYFVPSYGTNGTGGTGGAGGSGGGGGAMDDYLCDAAGDGGNGGSGGGGGGEGGEGAHGGGSSFGIFITNSASVGSYSSILVSSGSVTAVKTGGSGGSGGVSLSGETGQSDCDGEGYSGAGGTGASGGVGGKGGDANAGVSYPYSINGVNTTNPGTSIPYLPTITLDNFSQRNNISGKMCNNSEIDIKNTTGSAMVLPLGLLIVNDLTSSTSSYGLSSNPIKVTTDNANTFYNIQAGATVLNKFLYTAIDNRSLPAVAITPSSKVICKGSSIDLSKTNSFDAGNIQQYEYIVFADGSNANTPIYSSTSSSFTTPVINTTGRYWVRYRERHNCCGWSRPVFDYFDVIDAPNAPASINILGGPYCYDGLGKSFTITIPGSSFAFSTYDSWELFDVDPAFGTPTPLSTSTTALPSFGVTPIQTTTYYVRGKNACGVSTPLSVTAYISGDPLPTGVLATTTSSKTCEVNDTLWHYFRNNANEIIGAINSNGQNLGDVAVAVTIETVPHDISFLSPKHGNGGVNLAYPDCEDHPELSMRRWYTITPTNQPGAGSPSTIRLFFTAADYTNYTTEISSWITTYPATNYNSCYGTTSNVGDLAVSKNELSDIVIAGVAVGPNTSTQYELSVPTFSTFRWHTTGGYGQPLPIELLSFTGSNEGTYNRLNWVTATEVNTNRFEVEKSTDRISVWKFLESVPAAGNSNTANDYTITDEQTMAGNNYYRLKIIDIDGTITYSKIINIPLGVKEDNGFARVYPNPTSGNLNVEIQSTTNFETNVIAYDLVGKKIYDQKTSIEKGLNTLQIDFSNFASGVYVLQFSDVKGKIRTTKFVKE